MHTLYLTDAEAKKFAALPDELKKDVTVENEKLTYEDSPARRKIRFGLLRLKDPELVCLAKELNAAESNEDVAKAVQTLDPTKIGDSEFTQMLFALGPAALGMIVENLLSGDTSADDIEMAAAYSTLRHAMLESLVSFLS